MREYINYKPDIYEYSKEDNARFVLGNRGKNTLLCIGINPNAACEEYSDTTMNRLIDFTYKENYDSCIMVNAYPLMCSKISSLPKIFDEKLLLENLKWIEQVFSDNSGADVLIIWGDYIDENESFKNAAIDILKMSIKYKMRLIHINNLSKKGNPYHFMYLARSKEFYQGKYVINELNIQEYLKKLECN